MTVLGKYQWHPNPLPTLTRNTPALDRESYSLFKKIVPIFTK